jgi:outer membrane protein, multidrug efflux system
MRPLCACLLILSACSVGPDFTPPKPPEVATWNDPSAQSSLVSTQTNPDPKW